MSKLTPFFKDLLEKRWSEFALQEQDESYTSSQAVVFALIRACAKGRLPAIKESLNRIDGKVAMEIEVEYPKFYFQFPYATKVAGIAAGTTAPAANTAVEAPAEPDEQVTHSLRDTLGRMSDQPRSLGAAILAASKEIDVIASYKGDMPEQDPLVKSVIVAGLLNMAHNGSLGAIFEVLDQIDGRVADKIKLLGGDVYLTRMDIEAPAGSVLNDEGIYQLEADNTTSAWAAALERKQQDNGRFNR